MVGSTRGWWVSRGGGGPLGVMGVHYGVDGVEGVLGVQGVVGFRDGWGSGGSRVKVVGRDKMPGYDMPLATINLVGDNREFEV